MDIGDYAQVEEARILDRALSSQLKRPVEEPDEDAFGRYCLSCGEKIAVERLMIESHAVRCTPCQSIHETQEAIRVGRHQK